MEHCTLHSPTLYIPPPLKLNICCLTCIKTLYKYKGLKRDLGAGATDASAAGAAGAGATAYAQLSMHVHVHAGDHLSDFPFDVSCASFFFSGQF